MRKVIVKFLAVLTALSCVFALAVPERAYAFESYSRSEVSSAWGAGYAFLAERYPEIPYDSDFNNGDYGGFPGAADFVSTIVTAPSSPFMLWVHNYVYFWFSEWRVQTYDDLPDDSEAQQRLIDQQLDAADFIIREWEIWKEKYPGAGGGSSGSGSGDVVTDYGVIYVLHEEISDGLHTFPDGSTFTVPSGTAANFAAKGVGQYFVVMSSNAAGTALSLPNGYPNGRTDGSFALNISPAFNRPIDFTGINPCWSLNASAVVNPLHYVQAYSPQVWGNNYSAIPTDTNLAATAPSAFPAVVYPGASGTAYPSRYYVYTNMPVYSWGELLYGDVSAPAPDPDLPSGPTAPNYPSPETPTINNPVSPTIPLTFTDTGNTYTGNETDYSQYLQIIIDNQNTQIDQLKALSNGIVQIWDNYMGWLDSEFDVFYQFLQHFVVNWNTLFEWLHTISEDLFSIDQTFTAFRNECLDVLKRIENVLYRILDKLALRYAPDSPNPSINIEPGSGLDISDPLMTWIKGIIDNILAAISAGIAGLIGTATSSVGNLSNLFPFSLLFDLSLMLGLLNHEPVAPVFDIPYPFSANQNAVLIHVDLSPWTPVMESLRPMWVLLFALGLVYLSVDMIMALYNFLSPGGDN